MLETLHRDPPDATELPGARRDAIGDVFATIALIRTVWAREGKVDERAVREHANDAERFSTGDAYASVHVRQSVAGIPILRDVTDPWVAQNVQLIQGLDARHLADVETVIGTAYREGWGLARIERELQNRAGITRRRANLIARDQMGTLNSQVTTQRFAGLGITEAYWRASNDGRVRPLHVDLDGTRFDLRIGTVDGRPGEPIGCRCTQEAVMPGR